MIKELMDFA